mgnify:CR=1 FL=1
MREKEIAKLCAVKPVLGATKAAFLKDLGFVKEGTQWVKYGTKQELQELWDEIDVYKDQPKFVSKNKKYYGHHIHGMYYLKGWEYRIFNDAEIDFYLEVERVEDAAVAA